MGKKITCPCNAFHPPSSFFLQKKVSLYFHLQRDASWNHFLLLYFPLLIVVHHWNFFSFLQKKRCNLPVDGGVWAKAIVINKQRLLLLRLVIFIIYLLASIIQQQVHFLQNNFLKSPFTLYIIYTRKKQKPTHLKKKTESLVFCIKNKILGLLWFCFETKIKTKVNLINYLRSF